LAIQKYILIVRVKLTYLLLNVGYKNIEIYFGGTKFVKPKF